MIADSRRGAEGGIQRVTVSIAKGRVARVRGAVLCVTKFLVRVAI
jgi:hypothetical protein